MARPKNLSTFPCYLSEELRYFRKYGFFPIMHLMTAKRELVERHPELARQVMAMFEEAKQIAYQYYDDSDYSLIVWSRNAYEEQRRQLGSDVWVNGFEANRKISRNSSRTPMISA
jgi:4,5-dihydroxyphthalate decarboxylase